MDVVVWLAVEVEAAVEEVVAAVVSLTKALLQRYVKLARSCTLPRERW